MGSTSDLDNFSLFQRGPLFHLLQRLHLSDSPLTLRLRRVLVISGLAWIPLLLLLLVDATPARATHFFKDVQIHVRFLVSLPLLVFGEVYANEQSAIVVRQFLRSGVVKADDRDRFLASIERARRILNTRTGEACLLLLAVFGGHFAWLHSVQWEAVGWFGHREGGRLYYTLPGYWLAYISVPLFQFILLRWFYRLLIWFLFLLGVSRMNLDIVPAHPDRMGGLEFLSGSVRALAPMLTAMGALVSGVIATRIFFDAKDLPFFRRELIALGAVALIAALAPLLVFMPCMRRARLQGLQEYGPFAARYARCFAAKWIGAGKEQRDDLLGSNDIQALADLGNSFGVVERMSMVPFRLPAIVIVLASTYLPIAPLLLTMVPAQELLQQIVSILI